MKLDFKICARIIRARALRKMRLPSFIAGDAKKPTKAKWKIVVIFIKKGKFYILNIPSE